MSAGFAPRNSERQKEFEESLHRAKETYTPKVRKLFDGLDVYDVEIRERDFTPELEKFTEPDVKNAVKIIKKKKLLEHARQTFAKYPTSRIVYNLDGLSGYSLEIERDENGFACKLGKEHTHIEPYDSKTVFDVVAFRIGESVEVSQQTDSQTNHVLLQSPQ